MIIRFLKDTLTGKIFKYYIFTLLGFYLRTKGKKRITVQIQEFWQLAKYWKRVPQQYFEFEFFHKSCTLTLDEMKNFIRSSDTVGFYRKHNGNYMGIADDKSISADLIQAYNLPHPVTDIRYYRGLFYNKENQEISYNEVDTWISAQKVDRLFIKETRGKLGKNILAYTRDSGGSYRNGSEVLSASIIDKRFRGGSAIVQHGVTQDPLLARINKDSVNTIRVLSRFDNGVVTLIDATLKVGRKGSVVDNAGSGGLLVNINVDTGEFGEYGKFSFNVKRYYKHPDSDIAFKGLIMPRWEEVTDLVKKAASSFHYFRFIGWDIAVTDSGVTIIEINGRPSVYTQITTGGIADKLYPPSKDENQTNQFLEQSK